MSRLHLAVVALGLSLVPQPGLCDEPLDRASRELTLAAQKIAREIAFSLSQARALERSDPQRAREILRQSKALLEDDVVLPERQRQDLLRQVNGRLADLSATIAAQKKADEIAARQAADKIGRQQKAFEDSKKPGSSGTSTIAGGRIASTQDVLAKVDELRGQRERGRLGVLSGIEASATPFDGVIEYPKYWKQITDMRKQKLHPSEVALLKALNSVMSVDFKNEAFSAVMEYLQEKTGQAIIIDENSLKDAMIESNDPVTFKANKITVRTILRKILADRGLSYILTQGTIQVVTAQKARETTVIRTYPVSDLIGVDPRFYGLYTPLVVAKNAQALIDMIQQAVEPGYWQANGGPGTITFHPGSMSLVVRASAEMHYMFGGTGLLDR